MNQLELIDDVPEIPLAPPSARELIMCILEASNRPLNVKEIRYMLEHRHGYTTSYKTLHNRLSEMATAQYVRRPKRGYYELT